MMESKIVPAQPFWVDSPNPNPSTKTNQPKIVGFTLILVIIYSILSFLCLFAVIITLAVKFPIFWILVFGEVAVVGATIVFARSRRSRAAKIVLIQRRAKEKTGAAYIGSALHTAGHPLLKLDQPIVLGLKDSTLSIYDYASSVPIDALELKDLQQIETVTYDADRVPHTGVVDNTAQALQLTFPWRGNPCTCIFRRMYKVRPIEWYQAIQTARLITG